MDRWRRVCSRRTLIRRTFAPIVWLLAAVLLLSACSSPSDTADASTEELPDFTPANDRPDPYSCRIVEYHFPSGEGGIENDYVPLGLSLEAECMCSQFLNGVCSGEDHVWFHGSFKRWHTTGQPAQVGAYRYNEVHGRWKIWAGDGTFVRGHCWNHGIGLWQTLDPTEADTKECPTDFL
ncbi:MAG: hypothetical protein ACI9OJ_001305 [Myxococcota bacterium]|jgi:hypothetical protein